MFSLPLPYSTSTAPGGGMATMIVTFVADKARAGGVTKVQSGKL